MQVVDHVVVGGGVMGSAAAWQLASRGREVLLLERFAPGHVRGASHGASRIYRTTYDRPEYVDLAVEALALWQELPDDVLTLTGGVSHGRRSQALADSFVRRGVPHAWLTPDEAHERWPGLRFEGAVLHETTTAGRVHADRAVAALQTAARSAGAEVRHEVQVLGVTAGSDGVTFETSAGPVRAARSAVVAVGAWTAGLVGPALGVDLRGSLVVTQEQPAHFAVLPGAPDEDTWPSFTHDPLGDHPWPSGTYGLATPGEGIKVGFHGVGPVTDPDRRTFTAEPGQLALLQEYAAQWLPGVDASAPVPLSCTYTTTPDSDFVLDRRGPLVVAGGFSGHGFKFAPAIGRVLADLALEAPDAPVRAADPAFHLGRLAGRPPAAPPLEESS